MASHHRSRSPGGRRIVKPGRTSDPYLTQYVSPRGSTERVIPISTTTYVNVPRGRSSSDAYQPPASISHRTLYPDDTHLSATYTKPTHLHPASANIYPSVNRIPSPLNRSGRTDPKRSQDVHLAPPSSAAPRREPLMHKKVYSIDAGKSQLVADIAIHPVRTEKRVSEPRDYHDRGHTSSHRTHNHRSERDEIVSLGSGYSYTDPAGMYRDTEPRQRHRAGSLEATRSRPTSMIVDSYPSRSSRRDVPPISGGLAKYNESIDSHTSHGIASLGAAPVTGAGLSRARSLREAVRSPEYSLYKHEDQSRYAQDRLKASYDDRHAPGSSYRDRLPDRREAYTAAPVRDSYEGQRTHESSRIKDNHAVGSRGFGARPPGRTSDEQLDRREAHYDHDVTFSSVPREPLNHASRDDARREQEQRDHAYARELERQERERELDRWDRERVRDRESREPLESERKERHRERPRDDPAYSSDRDRLSLPREATRDRDHSRDRRDFARNTDPRRSSAESMSGTLPAAAIGGLGAAAVASAIAKNHDNDRRQEYHSLYDTGRDDKPRRNRERDDIRRTSRSPPLDYMRDDERERRKEQRLRASHGPERYPAPPSDHANLEERRDERRPRDLRETERTRSPLSDHERRNERHLHDPREVEKTRSPPSNLERREERSDERRPRDPRELEKNRSPPSDHERRDWRPDERRPREPREMESNRSPPVDHERRDTRPDDRRPGDHREVEKHRSPPASVPQVQVDPEEEFRRRFQQAQKDLNEPQSETLRHDYRSPEHSPEPISRRLDHERPEEAQRSTYQDVGIDESPPPQALRHSPDTGSLPGTFSSTTERERATREARVRILEPPKDDEDQQPRKGILRKPTKQFPEDPNPIREGVAPLKDSKDHKDIPENARWTKISRELVNPDCLREAKERFEEREDCVIVLRVVPVDEIQKLADRTAQIRNARYDEADRAHKAERSQRRRKDRDQDRHDRDEYSDHSEDEYEPRAPRLLEAPATDVPPDFVRDSKRHGERDIGDHLGDRATSRDGGDAYMSGGL